MNKELAKLQGGKIIAIGEDRDFVDDFGQPVYALIILLPNGKTVQAAILADAEGNGPGFLAIEPLSKVAE